MDERGEWVVVQFVGIPLWANSVEKLDLKYGPMGGAIGKLVFRSHGFCFWAARAFRPLFQAIINPDFSFNGINHFAILRKFCAVAANKNSSWAPHRPRSRSRSSFKMRLRWANSISTFLRCRPDLLNASVSAILRATSRAPS